MAECSRFNAVPAGGHLAPFVVLGGLGVGLVLGERINGWLDRPAPASQRPPHAAPGGGGAMAT